MAIRVRHEVPYDISGQVAAGIGHAQAGAQDSQNDMEMLRFLLNRNEQQRQFNTNTALRAQEQFDQNRRYDAQLGAQQFRQQALLADQEQQRQYGYAREAMEQQAIAERQQAEMDYRWQAQGVGTIEDSIKEQLKAAQQMPLNPEGQRLRNEKMADLRKIQSQRSSIRPDAYNDLLGQWASDFQEMGLDAYEEKQPTAQEQFYEGLVPLQGQTPVPGQPLPPGKYRVQKAVRNGQPSWETIEVPNPEPQTTSEKWQLDAVPLPNGGFAVRKPDGSWDEIGKQSGTQKEPTVPGHISQDDYFKFYKEAQSSLISERERNAKPITDAEGKNIGYEPTKPPTEDEINEEIKKRQRAMEKFYGGDKQEPDSDSLPASQEVSPTDRPSIAIQSRGEAEELAIGEYFILNGMEFIKTGPDSAEPVGQ